MVREGQQGLFGTIEIIEIILRAQWNKVHYLFIYFERFYFILTYHSTLKSTNSDNVLHNSGWLSPKGCQMALSPLFQYVFHNMIELE